MVERSAAPADAAAFDGEAPRKRRRRGGRGRNKHREGIETAAPATKAGERGTSTQRIVERKPHPHAGQAAAATATATPAAHAPKQGFFRRIMRMFGRH